MGDNNNNDDIINNQQQQMVECYYCELSVPESEQQNSNFYCYKTPYKYQDEFIHACEQCFYNDDNDPFDKKMEWPDVEWPVRGRLHELCYACVVLAKFEDKWLHATVWKIDKQKRECQVEFHDEQKGTQDTSFDNIILLFTREYWGKVIQKMHKFKSYSDYLGMSMKNQNVEGVQIQDNLIPQDLKNSLTKNFDKIANFNEKDFHPGSNGKVQNLVHPSLFCYVKGVSMKKDGTIENFSENNVPDDSSEYRRHRYNTSGEIDFFGRNSGISKYQWLPTNFNIDNNGKVQIQNYINGLTPREKYVNLYNDLEKVFEFFIPMLENCLEYLYNSEYITHSQSNKKQKPFIKQSSCVKNRTLQVFVKAANYILQPGQTHEGVWHVEGVSQEHIIATSIYYYEVSDNIQDEGLAFRRGLTEDEEQNITMEYHQDYPPPYECDSCVLELGTIHTKQGRCIVFPNSHQHKLQKLLNKSDTNIAIRKILCFFIVNPDKSIISTNEVHDQNWKVAKIYRALELQKIAKRILGQPFPNVVALKILNMSKFGFTLEEAQKNRLALMQFRKFYKDEMNRDVERPIQLCEH